MRPERRTSERTKRVEAGQGLVALVGITLGVIPIVGLVIGAGPSGVFRWVFGQPAESTSWILAVVVVVIGLGGIAALERAKPRSER